MISPVQSHYHEGSPMDRRSLLRWEGFVEKIRFEPGVKEWRSDGCWEWGWWEGWVDKWMRRWIETKLGRLMKCIWKLIPKTSWCISKWAICDFQWWWIREDDNRWGAGTEQNRFYLLSESKTIIKKNRRYKWQATRRANCPSKLAALNIAFNLIYVLTRREKDGNNQSTRCKVQVQGTVRGLKRDNVVKIELSGCENFVGEWERILYSICCAEFWRDDRQCRRRRLCVNGVRGLLRCFHECLPPAARPVLDWPLCRAWDPSHELDDHCQRIGWPVRDTTVERRRSPTRPSLYWERYPRHARTTLAADDWPSGTGSVYTSHFHRLCSVNRFRLYVTFSTFM